jgi:transposase InsO family protein
MVWQAHSVEQRRQEFVRIARQHTLPFRQLCARFEISPPTGYKWLERAATEAADWAQDRSRRPGQFPTQTDPTIEAKVVELRRAHPAWGGRKLQACLKADGVTPLPAPSTITNILHRAGLITADATAQRHAPQRFERPRPNDLWQMDFMGHLPLGTAGQRLHLLTLLDDHSRYALGAWACANERLATVQEQLRQVFRQCGLPLAILTDNGPPWGTSGAGGTTALEAWLIRLGVTLLHGRPYHPQTQGKIERLHATIQIEVTQHRSFADLAQAQRAIDCWRTDYNTIRPHEALEMATPADRYQVSQRPFPEVLPPIIYLPGDRIRKVRSQGSIEWDGQAHFIGSGLVGEQVAIRPTEQDGVVAVYFCHQQIRLIDLHRTPEA